MRTGVKTARIQNSASRGDQVRRRRPLDIREGRYAVRIAQNRDEVESALRLRYEVFKVELAGAKDTANTARIEFDEYDFKCRHLLVIDHATGETVGTYRLNTIETALDSKGFYSYNEFTIEDLPAEVLRHGIEIGRACVAPAHRNSKVLFLLWKGLANYLKYTGKRYFFGCCSIFTLDEKVGASAYHQLKTAGHFHRNFAVRPRQNELDVTGWNPGVGAPVELPALFHMYLRIGAKLCSTPIVDRDFGTIDLFVVFDASEMNEKYRRLFFG
jgi:putative hemolysin